MRQDGDLATVTAPVDAHLEVAEIHRRVIAADGPALLFTNVKGKAFPLATNLFGSKRRAALAFGDRPLALVRRLVELAQTLLPPNPAKLWGARDVAGSLLKVGLTTRGRGPVTEVVSREPRLDRLPAITCWPEDGGPFVTLPLVYTESPRGHGHNLAMYRLHVYDEASTGMHWQIGKGGGFHYAEAEAAGQALPATVMLGGPPALILSAIAPLPENVPELLLASLVAGQRLARVPGPFRHPHPIVASCEFALLGEVAPFSRRPEGPFGDHYGYYSLRHDYPVFRVHTVAHRRDAIYPATVVGKPRQEDFYIGDLLQELLSPLFPLVMPAVEKLWSYGETGYHSLAAAVVKQRYPREAMASAFRILGEGQLSLQKFLLLTDRVVDLTDFRATLEHVLARTDPRTDLYVFGHLSMDTLDYTGPQVNRGSKGVWMGLGDPVRDLPRAFAPPVPPPPTSPPSGSSAPAVSWSGRGRSPRTARRRRGLPPIRPSPAGRCWSSPTSPIGRRAARSTSCGPPSRASSPPPISTPRACRSSATTSCSRRRWRSTRGSSRGTPPKCPGRPTSPGWSPGAGASTFPTDG